MAAWRTVKTFYSRPEAEIARSFLESNGIAAQIISDDMGGIGPELSFSNGVRLLVEEDELANATALLEKDAE